MANLPPKPNTSGRWIYDGDLGWIPALPPGYYKNQDGIVVKALPEGFYKNHHGIVVARPTEQSRREDQFRSRARAEKDRQIRGRER